MPRFMALPLRAVTLAAIAGAVAVIGGVWTIHLWADYREAASAATHSRSILDDALKEARYRADVIIDAQDETERLREFATGHADCLRVNPWSPLCNNWSAESNLAAAEAALADLEADMDLAFARAAVVRIPSDAARADADEAFAAAAGVGTAAMAAATATLGLAILTAHRARPVRSWRGGERQ
jgi:hypothetical protein